MKPMITVEEALGARARFRRDAARGGKGRPRSRLMAACWPATLRRLRTQPPFPNSAMDGYALRAADTAPAPATLTVIGESAAGRAFEGAVGPGEAVRIFTGAPMPRRRRRHRHSGGR